MLIGIFNPLGAQSDRLRCEVCQNLILSPMNTGLLRYAVATAPTVYGIETGCYSRESWASRRCNSTYRLRYWNGDISSPVTSKARLQQHLPFTVLKLSQEMILTNLFALQQHLPFTVLKLDLETLVIEEKESTLQQHLPFTVLKL